MTLAAPSTLKNPILDIAASFWDDERYRAFRICYRSMRVMDDVVDDLKSAGQAGEAERDNVRARLRQTLTAIETEGAAPREAPDLLPAEIEELRETIKRFSIPLWPWRSLARAMEFDLSHNGFRSFLQFARYARGAAVAPASVFVHLIGLSDEDGRFRPAPVDCYTSARPLAMFSYMTHIMRDFRRDFSEGLEYFPQNMRDWFGVSPRDLRAAGAGEQTERFSAMVRGYHTLAGGYRERARPSSLPICTHLCEIYRFSLTVIWELYSQIHEKIAEADFDLDPELIHPAVDEIYARIDVTRGKMGISKSELERGASRLGMRL
ncbi:MAG: squalene/phytoene synthase family protein [Candidatus Zixiibacteriota bacterium]